MRADVVRGEDEVQKAAMRMLFRVAGDDTRHAVTDGRHDALIRRLLAAGATEADIRNGLGLGPDELVAALWRIAR